MSPGSSARASNDNDGERLRRFLGGTRDYGLIVLDPEGLVTSWNAGAERMAGHTAEESLGRHLSFLYAPGDPLADERAAQGLRIAAAKGRHEETSQFVRKDGSLFWGNVVFNAITDGQGGLCGFGVIARDLTGRREAEVAQERLRQAQRMESLGQLSGGVAHDFNNLLVVIRGNLELLRDGMDERDPGRAFVDPCLRAAERGAALTRQLLGFGRRQLAAPEVTAANPLVDGFATLLRRTLGERFEIVTGLDPEAWPVRIDPGQLENALLNLALNARDAMAAGGRLLLETVNRRIGMAEAMGVPPGDYLMIAVGDNGAGMPPDVAARVFEPFFTTKPAGKGSGLGLAMVRAFVRQADGHIRIDSESGRGTLVRLYLPRAETVVPARDAAPAAPPVAPAATPARILVVEDDADVLQVTLAMLRALGHEVLAAPSGDAALGLIEGRADIDLMLCDVMLAGALNGPDLARRASAMRPGLAILFVSGYAESGVIDRDIIGAGYDLLPKPFRRADLRLRIDAILAARRSPR